MNTRGAIFLDYSYLLPKLNLNFVLDDAINAYSGNTEGFKKFELVESDSNSKLNDRPAYTNTTNNTNSINQYGSNFNELPIEEIFGKDDNN